MICPIISPIINNYSAFNHFHKLRHCYHSILNDKIFSNHLKADFSSSAMRCQKPVELAYTTYDGSSNSNPLLILHGLLGSKMNWKSLAKNICKKTQRKVITLDARNHGDSPHNDVTDYESMAADVELFVMQHKIPKVVLVGHSMGGKTAMLTALNKPDILESLVVVDMTPRPVIVEDPSSAPIAQLLAKMKQSVKELPSKGLTLTEARRRCDAYLAKDFPDTSLRQFVLTNLVQSETGETFWRTNIDALQKNYASILSYVLPEKQFHKPALFICGSESEYIGDKDKEAIYGYFPKAEVVIIEGAGHWVHADKPEDFVAVLSRFMKDSQG